ncbi:MAG: hypothetical protein ACTSR1_06170, partial [Candidatus Heimdallarchaeota archaeon]
MQQGETKSIAITDLENFTLLIDSPHIASTKNNTHIEYLFNGSSNSWVTERYIYRIDPGYYVSDFAIQVKVDYSYTDTNDLMTVGLIVGSYYDGFDNYMGDPNYLTDQFHVYAGIEDSWSENQARHHLSLHNNSVVEGDNDSNGAAGLSGTAMINQTRVDDELSCSVMDNTGATTFVDHVWENSDEKINFLMFYFNTQNVLTDANATISSIVADLVIEQDEIIRLSDFSSFYKVVSDPYIDDVNNDTHIEYKFQGTAPSYPFYERYSYYLPVNCTDFFIELKL